MAPCSSLILLMFKKDKALPRNIMVGVREGEGGGSGVGWNGVLLGQVRGQAVPCRFCGAPDSDGHLFWECPFPPLVEIRENPEFHDLMRMDKGHWPVLALAWLGSYAVWRSWCLPLGS